MTSGPSGDTEAEIPEWVNAPGIEASRAAAPPGETPAPVPDAPPARRVPTASPAPTGRGPTTSPAPDPGGEDWDEDGWDDWSDDHGSWGQRRGHWGRRILVLAGVLLLVLIAAAAGTVLWINGHLTGAGSDAVQVELPVGAGHATLAGILTRQGVVSDGWLFKHYLDYRGTDPANGGQYTFHHGEGYRAALHDLGLGPKVVQVRITIPEGYDLAETAAVVGKLPGLSAQRFLQIAQSGQIRSRYEPANVTSLEGLVFPDTYFVDQGETEAQILQTMVDRFDSIADSLNLATPSTGLTPYQTVIVASLIEKEAKLPQDRGKIARVVLNRLADHMRLQIDATVEYAEGVHKTKLLDSDLQVNSPYNTYRIDGLPPGPIASPGKASLAAALSPTPGTWLYYVLINPDGEHAFATTASQFDQLVAEARAKGL